MLLYVNLKKHDSLKKEPYAAFTKKFNMIRDNLNGEQIDLRVGGKDGTFANGFYIDEVFYKNPELKFDFAVIPSPEDATTTGVFIRATYAYEGEDYYEFDTHLQRVRDIKKRAPYYYIPSATHFEFSSQIEDEYKLYFDAVATDADKALEVCYSLISLIISIFSLEN